MYTLNQHTATLDTEDHAASLRTLSPFEKAIIAIMRIEDDALLLCKLQVYAPSIDLASKMIEDHVSARILQTTEYNFQILATAAEEINWGNVATYYWLYMRASVEDHRQRADKAKNFYTTLGK